MQLLHPPPHPELCSLPPFSSNLVPATCPGGICWIMACGRSLGWKRVIRGHGLPLNPNLCAVVAAGWGVHSECWSLLGVIQARRACARPQGLGKCLCLKSRQGHDQQLPELRVGSSSALI